MQDTEQRKPAPRKTLGCSFCGAFEQAQGSTQDGFYAGRSDKPDAYVCGACWTAKRALGADVWHVLGFTP